MTFLRSRDNPRVKRWVKLASDASYRRAEKTILIEGPHLVSEALQAGLEPLAVIVSESARERPEIQRIVGKRGAIVLTDRVFNALAQADTPQGLAAEIRLPQGEAKPGGHVVFLEGIQDPSNVGAIVRSAAGFGVSEVVLDRACADAWSPKAVRAAQGGHFKLALRHVPDLSAALEDFAGMVVCTVLTEGVPLRTASLTGRLGWVFGAEGQGVSKALARRAHVRVTISMAPGTESLNVAAAAAICLYETFTRNSGSGS